MTLTPGTRLGPYEIISGLGVGGMGEVYRARDAALNRDVAVKVLPASFASDPDRLARFQREAQVLASLNHPHIAHIYGLERLQSDLTIALVMELVEGEDLSQRIDAQRARGLGLPLEEAVAIADQIADALDAAHGQGIVHRDLKPANIKVRPDGTVKVLDFGLAKAMDGAGQAGGVDGENLSRSPTITTPAMTQAGVILGTAAYMSPEQARGKSVDKRTDVWAFGAVLFEMLTGRRAFIGEEVTDVIAAVVRDEPDWRLLPVSTPANIRRLLRRSLTKDRRHRLADMADVRLELNDTSAEGPTHDDTAKAPVSRRREWLWAGVAVVSLLAAAGIVIRGLRAPSSERPIVRFDIAPSGGVIEWGQPVSPDGRMIAFISNADGKPLIWVRPLDSGAARPLPGTEGATRSFWSPDSQYIAFFIDGNLKKVAVSGGPAQPVANGPFRDGAWSTDGVMLVGGQLGRPLLRVSASGGEARDETTLDKSLGEVSHDYPEFLPDGRHYIYLARRGVRGDEFTTYVGTIGSKDRRQLPDIRTSVKYSPTGHLLFLRGTTLMARPFDPDRLELSGEAFPVAEQVAGNRVCTFAVSNDGTLSFIGGASAESELTWFDRTGTRLGSAGPTGVYYNASLSRDGRFVAFDRGSPPDVWVLDLERGAASKMTSDRAEDHLPVWSPNGQTMVFASNRGGAEGLYERTVGVASDDRLLVRNDVPMLPWDWSRDGQYVSYAAGGDVWALPMFGDRKPLRLTESPFFQEGGGTFSPDGRWIAYQSDESSGVSRSGEGDVFVQSFPQKGITRQVSTAGGFIPRWSDDGKELFYVAPGGAVMAVAVTSSGSTLDIGAPRTLFRPRLGMPSSARYSVSSNGRFLVREPALDFSITVIVNWFEQLKRSL